MILSNFNRIQKATKQEKKNDYPNLKITELEKNAEDSDKWMTREKIKTTFHRSQRITGKCLVTQKKDLYIFLTLCLSLVELV